MEATALMKQHPLMPPISDRRPRVVVLGAGFAGLNCARQLARLDVEVTVVDRNNCNVFQPLLYQVAMASLAPSQIASPVRSVLKNAKNTDVVMDEVAQIDLDRRRVTLGSGTDLVYDYLIVATGSEKSFFGHPEWEAFAPGLKTVEDALEIRRRVLLAFETAERDALRTGTHAPLDFLIIGGGPTGVELAGAVAEMTNFFLRKDFRHVDAAKSKVTLIDGSPRILGAYPADLSRSAVQQLNRLGVEVRNDVRVQEIGNGYVKVATGETFVAAVIMWGAGVATSPVAKMLGVPLDKKGRVVVNNTLNPDGHPELFACGDIAMVVQNGKELPGVAQPAIQMGSYAANAIARDLANQARRPFRYFDKGTIATIGRYSAVGDIHWPFNAHWSGLDAWLTWMGVHVAFLLGFRNRLSVLWELTWTYLLLMKDDRLIISNQPVQKS